MLGEAVEATGVPDALGWEDSRNDINTIIAKAWQTAIYPFQLAVSPFAIKTYLTTLLFLTTSAILLSISTTAYSIFYYKYIPQTSLELPIYLQYPTNVGSQTLLPKPYPIATINLPRDTLISNQAYDVWVELDMPHSHINNRLGNFMVDLSLTNNKSPDLTAGNILPDTEPSIENSRPALFHSRRPALIPYTSRLHSLASRILFLPIHLIGLRDNDSTTLTIPVFEKLMFSRAAGSLPNRAHLEVQTQENRLNILQIYAARLKFQAKFGGLRYLIYNYRIISFLVFTSLFYTVSISTLGLVWAGIAFAMRDGEADMGTIKKEKDKDSGRTIKQENGDADLLSTTTNTLPYSSISLPPTRADSHKPASEVPVQASISGGEASEHADDEEEAESEDEWEQMQRLREKMAEQARRQTAEREREMNRDSGIGTSMESSAGGSSNLNQRKSQKSNDWGSMD